MSSGVGPVVGGVVAGGAVAAWITIAAPALFGPGVDDTMRIVLALAAGSIAALLGVLLLSVVLGRSHRRRSGDAHPDAPPRAPVSMSELELTDIVADDAFLTTAEPRGIDGAVAPLPLPLAPGERIETFDLGGDPTLAQRMLARMAWESRAAA